MNFSKNSVNILGVHFTDLDIEESLELIVTAICSDKAEIAEIKGGIKIYTPNPEIVMLAQKDSDYQKVLNRGNLVVADGVGVTMAAKIKGQKLHRIPGIDLFTKILEEAKGASIYLIGAKQGVAQELSKILKSKYNIRIAGFSDGYFSPEQEPEIVSKIAKSKADIVAVALGAPKQESFIDKYAVEIGAKIYMGVGGTFDVLSGNVKRAPKIFSRIGLEWLYRLATEPSRLPRLFIIPKFLYLAFAHRKSK